MSHLPYAASEEEYLEDARQRYSAVHDDLSSFDSAPAAAGFTATAVAWLETRQRSNDLVPTGDDEWFDEYARKSYESGRAYARDDLKAAGHSPSRTSLRRSRPHQRALATLHDRQRRYWRDLATDLREEVRDTLRNSLPANATASEARDLIADRVEKTGLNRARKIAETEPAWGFNRAYLAEAQAAGIDRVAVDASWETAGDQKVCADCAARAGTYPVQKAIQLMESGAGPPNHSLCRCRWEIS